MPEKKLKGSFPFPINDSVTFVFVVFCGLEAGIAELLKLFSRNDNNTSSMKWLVFVQNNIARCTIHLITGCSAIGTT